MSPGDRPRSLVFYVNGHGFGHATRSAAILHQLRRRRPLLPILIRTDAPGFLFRAAAPEIAAGEVDPGTVQADPLTLDVEGSLEARRGFQARLQKLVEEETGLLSGRRVGLIAGDIPPLAFEVAARLGVPSVALGNFSWDWIFEPYTHAHRNGEGLLEAMRRSYSRADLLLRMPLHGDMSVFRRIEDIPHVVRRPQGDVVELRRRLGLGEETRPVVLVSFGGFGSVRFRRGADAADLGDFRFVVPGDGPSGLPPDTLRLPVNHGHGHENLVAACDVVLSKPGYGTVAECLATRTPLLYTSRDDFREYPILVEGLRRTARCGFLSREDLLGLRWGPYLEKVLRQERPWAPVRTDGAEVAAGRLLDLLER